jgi:hypothetical protein
MKRFSLYKSLVAGFVFAGLAVTPSLRADVEVLLSGGNASSSVLFDRATNLFGGTFTQVYGASSSTVRTYVGTIPGQTGLGTVTLDYVLNGAVGGLIDISQGNPETTAAGNSLVPTAVDSSTSPDVVGVNPALFTALPTYAVPYIFIKKANSANTASITNLTQRQAALLEAAGATVPASFFGGTGTNVIYFIGRNKDSAVRTEVDLNIQANGFQTYTTNSAGQPVQDTTSVDQEGNIDPGQTSASTLVNVVKILTNSIGTIAVQNLKSGVTPLAYEGVTYSTTNVLNGSYPLWGYENYYYLATLNNAAQLAVINLLYNSVTNATFQSFSNPVFTNYFIPYSSVSAQLQPRSDGGPIIPAPAYH